jgi:hypothetical protein
MAHERKKRLSTPIFIIWKLTAAQHTMELTRSERAKTTDSVHSIQSARASLAEIEKDKVPDVDEIQDCLEGVPVGPGPGRAS